ncbi:DUF6106 family protein [Clostridium sp. DL1XJH146]
MDQFYELLLTTKKSTLYKIVNIFVYIVGIIGLLILSVNLILGLVFIIVSVVMFFYKKNLYVEYEYDFTNGEIDIDKIYEMKKRKRIITFNIKDVELLALENSDFINDFSNKPKEVITCIPSSYNGKIYTAMITMGSNRKMLKFAPDEKFLNLCFKLNPRAVKKY